MSKCLVENEDNKDTRLSFILCDHMCAVNSVSSTIEYLATEKLNPETWDRIYSELQNSISDLFNSRYKYEQLVELRCFVNYNGQGKDDDK